MKNMARRTSMSKVYSITAVVFIILAALIASAYVPRGPYTVDSFIQDLRVSKLIMGIVAAMTLLAVTALGMSSLINVFELTQDHVVQTSDAIVEKLDEWKDNIEGL